MHDDEAPHVSPAPEHPDGKRRHGGGIDLATELHLSGALRAEDAVDYAIQACEALAGAHNVGVLHCDLRPEKLFVSLRDGVPFVTVLISIISVIPGPEMRLDLDHRTDVYSLGVTLGGKPLFSYVNSPPSPSGRVMVTREYAPLRVTRPDLPSDLVATVEKAFSELRSDRYDFMASFALALAPFAPPRSRPVLDRLARKAGESRRSDTVTPLAASGRRGATASNAAPAMRPWWRLW